MDLGIVCIGADTRGIRDLIGDKRLLCSPKSPADFARAIDFLMENPVECKKITERNRAEAKLYSKEIVRSEFAAIYKEVLK